MIKLQFKENIFAGEYEVGVNLYNRNGEHLAIDFGYHGSKQLFINGVTIKAAEVMIKELEKYIKDKNGK